MASQIVRRITGTFKNSKDARRLVSNFSYLSLLQIGGYVLPVLTYPYLARVIGVEGFGRIAFAMSVVIYFLTITDWGFNYSATRDVARNRNNVEEISNIYSKVTTSKIVLMLFSLLIFVLMLLFIPQFRDDKIVLILSFSIVVGHTIFPEWLFQGLEDMKLMVLLNLGAKIIFTLLVFVVIKQPTDYFYQPLFSGLGYILAGVISLWYVHRKLSLKFRFCSIKEVFDCIRDSFDVFLNNLMPNLYTSVSVIVLSACHGSIATGILDGATKFYSICSQFLTVLSRAFFPFLSRRLDKHTIYVKIKLAITIIFSLCLIAGARPLVTYLLSNAFEESIIVLQMFGISLIFHSITNIYGTNYLILVGEERKLRKITMIVSILGFIVAFPLIYLYSYIGAAVTITLSRVLLGVVVFITAKAEEKKHKTISNDSLKI